MVFLIVDPTPPSEETDIDILTKVMMSKADTLWERYRAMFSLRDLARTDVNALMALKSGFSEKDSALFRHEIAFVLGKIVLYSII